MAAKVSNQGRLNAIFAEPKINAMFKKGTKLNSTVKMKCPRCQEGDLFDDKNPYNPKTTLVMNETCSNCGLRFNIEAGFFYGAMYVSYALTVAISVAVYVTAHLFFEPTVSQSLIAIFIALLLMGPVVFRLSRALWLNLFVKYNPEARGEKP